MQPLLMLLITPVVCHEYRHCSEKKQHCCFLFAHKGVGMNSFGHLKIENKHNLLCWASFECVLNPKLDLKAELYEQYFSLDVVFPKTDK